MRPATRNYKWTVEVLDESGTVLMTDRQVNTNSKAGGQLVFSSSGKPPGNNHKKYGGNLLFCDGHADYSIPSATVSLTVTQGIVLLNPK